MTASTDHVSDGVMPTRRPTTAPWPIAVELSPEVQTAWVELQVGIASAGAEPPCQREPDLWWGDGTKDAHLKAEAAVHGCRACPALVACRTYALAAGRFEQYGVWGGLTATQRAAMRKAER